MGVAHYLVLLLTHPLEFRTLVQYNLYHANLRDLTAVQEHPTSGWDRHSMRRCWHYLDETSRSFSVVVKQLEGDLARTICLFYLVLRALDTIEDDMTLDPDLKQELLRNFHIHAVTKDWTFSGSGPNEKDRIVLVEYNNIAEELGHLPAEYRKVILDICRKMETGMADYCLKAEKNQGCIYLPSLEEYDLYCHYVAGLVGEGLSRLFSVSKKEAPWLAQQLEISNSMGLLLQKTNIIRDYREDCEDNRFFWPKEMWGQFGFTEMAQMHGSEPEVKQRAQWVQSAMILDAMRHTTDALDYLRYLKNQSVFNFCAIPATMAVATLELCFMNPDMFQRNIKIRKAEAASLIMRSTNPREVGFIFRDYARRIHAKASPSDPSFLPISVACGKIEQWCEHNYPSFVMLSGGGVSSGSLKQSIDLNDPRSRIIQAGEKLDKDLAVRKRAGELAQVAQNPNAAADSQRDGSMAMAAFWIGAAIVFVFLVSAAFAWFLIRVSERKSLF